MEVPPVRENLQEVAIGGVLLAVVSRTSIFRFGLAKLLYMNALDTGTLVRRVVSIHSIDMAVETTLKTIATEVGVNVPRDTKFPQLWKLVDHRYNQNFQKSLPLKSEISRMHDRRNAVQHDGSIPSENDLKQHLTYVSQFLDEVVSVVAGLGLHQIFLSSVIENAELREMMETAEKNISSDPKVSMEASMRSFMWGKVLAQRQLGHFDPTLGAFDPQNRFQRLMREPVTEVIEPIVDRLLTLELGIDAVLYSNMNRIAPHPLVSSGMTKPADIDIADTFSSNYVEKNAWSCYSFVLDNILKWQERGLL